MPAPPSPALPHHPLPPPLSSTGPSTSLAYRSIKLTLGPQPPTPQQQQQQTAAAAAVGVVQDQQPAYLDPSVLREVLLGAVGFVETVAADRARQMRPPGEMRAADASVQV